MGFGFDGSILTASGVRVTKFTAPGYSEVEEYHRMECDEQSVIVSMR